MSVKRALLVIADIGGYTRFMKVHAINLAHAQEIIGRLLESLIEGARPRFRLSKLEGDAAFFYALEEDGASARSLEESVRRIRRSFAKRQRQLEVDRLCTCDSCTQVGQLELKFVAHRGEVAIQKVKSYRELAGMDVILLHRMLKNSVPATEYVLMTASAFEGTAESYKANATPIVEDFEGVGETTLHYVDLAKIEPNETPEIKPSFMRALWQHILLNLNSLIYIFRVKKPCAAMRNMDAALGMSMPPPSLQAAANEDAQSTR